MLNWANQFNIFLCLPANEYSKQGLHQFDILMAVGAKHIFNGQQNNNNIFNNWQHFIDQHKNEFLFGHINYDLKNNIEQGLVSKKQKASGFNTVTWFVPAYIIMVKNNIIYIKANNNQAQILEQILNFSINNVVALPKLNIVPTQTKANFIKGINAIKKNIQIGNCYEVNYCQHFKASNAILNPVDTFLALNKLSPNPFAACYKQNKNWLFCASPERFLTLANNYIYSQPIKGTTKRVLNNSLADKAAKQQLQNHFKERAENIMVVDLVRNDMSKICEPGTVIVNELCAIYTYPQVHQMISSISGKLKPNSSFTSIIKAMFPMGSMTGAPKYKVMQLIEQHEAVQRGLFSGSVGFIAPNGHADLNVVIRSMFYNQANQSLHFFAGGGITHYSNPVAEYHETLLKVKAIMALFGQQTF